MKYTLDWEKYIALCRRAAAEGAVLVKNDSKVLPFWKDEKVALFGRTQFDYITTGTGSGGMVHIPYKVNLYEGLAQSGQVILDEYVSEEYRKFIAENPFNEGAGWGGQPFAQKEMALSESFLRDAAKRNDAALFVVGRICGEDHDNRDEAGSYRLTLEEMNALKALRSHFGRLVVALNIGNIIDMEWMDEVNPDAVIYLWQGGCESGNGASDVLTGKVSPCGHLSDTVAHSIADYPSNRNFGNPVEAVYEEDIYVGYRYFETFARDKVRFPFGFGLSYTDFDYEYSMSSDSDENGEYIVLEARVTNVGDYSGKAVVQAYYEAPQGKLGKPLRQLVSFGKTKNLAKGESERIVLKWKAEDMASFDDSGATQNKDCFVLEAGEYVIYAGDSVRSAKEVGSVHYAEDIVTEKLSDALYPVRKYSRIKPVVSLNGVSVSYEETPNRKYSPNEHLKMYEGELKDNEYKENGYDLTMVEDGRITMDEFISSLSAQDMIIMSRGEGMCSVRVTPGVAGAFGGVSDRLGALKIPCAACSDGPSGIRMDCGTIAMQGPSGNVLASTFDKELLEELYEFIGFELRSHRIDALLGPGMNIRRHPLNGRNFEYFSEDPVLTGTLAAAELKGLAKSDSTGVIKHFACNNQETGRYAVDSIVSARALREIYLKGFEIAVKEGGAYMIMTTYGQLNGTYTASNYDLNTMLLRKDWKFDGITMTDWWANMNNEGEAGSKQYTSLMIKAQNDLYMVSASSEMNDNDDDSESGYAAGVFARKHLSRNTANILRSVMRTNAYKRIKGEQDEIIFDNFPATLPEEATSTKDIYVSGTYNCELDGFSTDKGSVNLVHFHVNERGHYRISFDIAANDEAGSLAQLPLTVRVNEAVEGMYTLSGDDKAFTQRSIVVDCTVKMDNYVKFSFAQSGMQFKNLVFSLIKD